MKTKKVTTILAVSFMFTSVFATVVMNNKNDGVVDSFNGLNLVNEERHELAKMANEASSNASLEKESAYYSIRLGNNSGLRFKYVLTKDMISSAFADANVNFENYTYGVYVAKTADLAGTNLVDKLTDDTVKKLKVEAVNKVVTENDVTFAAVLVGFDDEVKYNTDFTAISYVSNGTDTYYSAESGYSYMKAIEYYLDENNGVHAQLNDAQLAQLNSMKADNAVSYRVVEEEGNFNLYQYSVKSDANLGAPIQTIAVPGPATYEINLSTSDKPFALEDNTYTSTNQGIGSSKSTMVVTATSSGVISFDYTVSAEKGWDYLIVKHNSTEIMGKSHSTAQEMSGNHSIEVSKGDTITISYSKDSGGNKGNDCATIKFVTPEVEKPETSVVSFETNGAGVINPMIAMDGIATMEIPEVTKEGYYFAGWYTTSSFEEESKVNDSYSYTNDTKLYAKWLDLADAHPLMGTHYGINVTSSSSSSNSYTTLEVDFLGNYTANYSSYGNSYGTFVSYDEETKTFTTDSGKSVYYDVEKGVIVTHHTTTPSASSQYTIYMVDSTSQIYGSAVSVATFDGGAYRFVTIKDINENIFIDAVNNVVYDNVKAYDASNNEVQTSSISGQLTVVVKQNEEVLRVFGHDNNSLVTATSRYGVYNVVGSEDTVTLTGANRLVYSAKGTSKLSYTVESENVYTISSTGSYCYTLTFDHEAKTVVVTENKYNVSYDWNGHEYDVSNVTYVWAGSWLYLPKPNVGVVVEENGQYFIFQGWYTEETFENLFKQTKITSDTTLYAKWVEGYKVTFDAAGGTIDSNEVIVPAGEAMELPTPSHTEKSFVCWTYNGVEFAGDTEINGNITLVAKWKEAPFFTGTYAGYNDDRSNFGSASTTSTSYNLVISPDGSVSGKTNTKWQESNYVDGVMTFDNSVKFYVLGSSNGMSVAIAHYSLSTSNMAWDDYGLYAKYTDTKPTFKVVYWNNGFNKLIEVTVGDKVTYVYTDGVNKAMYIDVEITDFAGNKIAFADVCVDKKLTTELVLTANGKVVAKCKATTGETKYGYTFDDGRSGTYTGSLNGADATVVIDGYGYATVNGVNGTYTYDETSDCFVVVCDTTTYTFEVNGTEIAQVLDGYQGTYAGSNGELVLTGWGEATLDGAPITYEVKSGYIALMVGEETISINVDVETKSYAIASLSPFAGCTFVGTYYSEWDEYDVKLQIIFDDSAAISGVMYSGYGTSYYFYFTGTFDGQTLVLTITSAIDKSQNGKTVTFELNGSTLTCTASTMSTNVYTFTIDGSATCEGFSL